MTLPTTVSLTSVPCKILEHIIVSHLTQHLEGNTILSNQQNGFHKNHYAKPNCLNS